MTVYEDDEDEVGATMNMVFQHIDLLDGQCVETLIAMDEDFYDCGVFGMTTDVSNVGWDLKDVDIAIRELAMSVYLEWEPDAADRYDDLYYGIEIEQCAFDYREGVATHHYKELVKAS